MAACLTISPSAALFGRRRCLPGSQNTPLPRRSFGIRRSRLISRFASHTEAADSRQPLTLSGDDYFRIIQAAIFSRTYCTARLVADFIAFTPRQIDNTSGSARPTITMFLAAFIYRRRAAPRRQRRRMPAISAL